MNYSLNLVIVILMKRSPTYFPDTELRKGVEEEGETKKLKEVIRGAVEGEKMCRK